MITLYGPRNHSYLYMLKERKPWRAIIVYILEEDTIKNTVNHLFLLISSEKRRGKGESIHCNFKKRLNFCPYFYI